MPYYRLRIHTEYIDEERVSVMELPSTDWFVSLERDAKRPHLQGWIYLDIPYDSSNNRKAKTHIKPFIPFKPMVKFQNGVWSLTDMDMDRFEKYKTYCCKENTLWVGTYDKQDLLDYHHKFWQVNKELKANGTVKKATEEKIVTLLKATKKHIELYKEERRSAIKESQPLFIDRFGHHSGSQLTLRKIIDIVVSLNQNQVPVLDTRQLVWVARQVYATDPATREQYKKDECELIYNHFHLKYEEVN